MSEPQIARRCPSCGASIRVRAFFCPHCGKTLVDSHAESAAGSSDFESKQTGPKEELSPNTSEDAASNKVAVDNVAAASAAVRSRNPAMKGARDAVNRARGAARDVIEEDRFQAVEKLRHISSVLDEAAYDPSLRFVLVAAVLFVLFLVLLIASELIS